MSEKKAPESGDVHGEGRVKLGSVVAPSGALIVLDTGYLGLWSHDREPLLPDIGGDEDLARRANRSIDLGIDGPDAHRAGKLFDRQWHPRFLFDIPRDHLSEFERTFSEHARQNGLEAHLVHLPRRIPHRERISLSLEEGGGAGQMQFHGLWACAFADVPAGVELEVVAEPMASGPHEGRWARVLVECRPGRVERSVLVGHAMVDYREAADNEQDSGWRLFSGGEDDEYSNDAQNVVLLSLSDLIEIDGALEALLDEPPGAVFEREDAEDPFVRVTDWTPPGD